jgi:septal ring factor EnvC (AmiA/AmiB activator)
VEEEIDTTVSSATISALKKELKRLVNQRAMAVAARLSGNSQDEKLRDEEAKLSRIEAEIAHFKGLQAKGETKLPTESIKSEFLVLNPAALGFAIEALVNRLEGYRSSAKEKVRN